MIMQDEHRMVVSMFFLMRKERGWSVGKAARCLGISPPHLWRIENYQRAPSLSVLYKMSFLVLTKTNKSRG